MGKSTPLASCRDEHYLSGSCSFYFPFCRIRTKQLVNISLTWLTFCICIPSKAPKFPLLKCDRHLCINALKFVYSLIYIISAKKLKFCSVNCLQDLGSKIVQKPTQHCACSSFPYIKNNTAVYRREGAPNLAQDKTISPAKAQSWQHKHTTHNWNATCLLQDSSDACWRVQWWEVQDTP